MIKEAYCSFEVAKLLKEKGFYGQCHKFVETEDMTHSEKWNVKSQRTLSIPTHQMAMKWLRETYDVYIVPKKDFFGGCYTGRIYDGRRETITDKDDYIACSGYNNYEEAVESALKYSLENLI